MKAILILITLMSFPTFAHADNVCSKLFESVKLSEAQINAVITELYNLRREGYSSDVIKARIANTAFNQKIKTVSAFIPIAEIKKRMRSYDDASRAKREADERQRLLNEEMALKNGQILINQIKLVEPFFKNHSFILDPKSPANPIEFALRIRADDQIIEALLPVYKSYYKPIETDANKESLKRILNLNKPGEVYGTALALAVSLDNLKIAELLVDSGSDPLQLSHKSEYKPLLQGKYNLTILEYAFSKNKDIYEMLARKTTASPEKIIPIFFRLKDFDNIIKILNSKVPITYRQNAEIARDAIINDRFDIIEILLKNKKLNINSQIDFFNNSTLLHLASQNLKPAIVKKLLEKGANPNLLSKDKSNALEEVGISLNYDTRLYRQQDAIDVINALVLAGSARKGHLFKKSSIEIIYPYYGRQSVIYETYTNALKNYKIKVQDQ